MKEKEEKYKRFVVIAGGSNLGDSKEILEKAKYVFHFSGIIELDTVSHFYKTEPVGPKDQPWFVNFCFSGYTTHSPQTLLYFLKSTEYLFGRKKRKKWFERELDLDIIFYGDTILKEEKLKIPHPEIHKRKFVLQPASDIIPHFIHPEYNKTVLELLTEYKGKEKIIRID